VLAMRQNDIAISETFETNCAESSGFCCRGEAAEF
jgi:hypothetical protein